MSKKIHYFLGAAVLSGFSALGLYAANEEHQREQAYLEEVRREIEETNSENLEYEQNLNDPNYQLSLELNAEKKRQLDLNILSPDQKIELDNLELLEQVSWLEDNLERYEIAANVSPEQYPLTAKLSAEILKQENPRESILAFHDAMEIDKAVHWLIQNKLLKDRHGLDSISVHYLDSMSRLFVTWYKMEIEIRQQLAKKIITPELASKYRNCEKSADQLEKNYGNLRSNGYRFLLAEEHFENGWLSAKKRDQIKHGMKAEEAEEYLEQNHKKVRELESLVLSGYITAKEFSHLAKMEIEEIRKYLDRKEKLSNSTSL